MGGSLYARSYTVYVEGPEILGEAKLALNFSLLISRYLLIFNVVLTFSSFHFLTRFDEGRGVCMDTKVGHSSQAATALTFLELRKTSELWNDSSL